MKRIDNRILGIPVAFVSAIVTMCLAVACCVALPAVAMADSTTTNTQNAPSTGFAYTHDPRDNPSAMADIVADADTVYGFRPSPTGSLKDYASGDWADPQTVEAGRQQRIAYHESFREMHDLFDEMKDAGASTEQIARAISSKRNELRLAAYQDDPEGLERAKRRNLEEYGDENGGSPEYFYKKYGSWEKVIEKSFSVNSGMDACLGLYDDYYELYIASGQVPKLANTITVKRTKAAWKLKFRTSKQTLQTSQLYQVENACGEVTYKKKAGDAGIKVSRDGTVTVKSRQPVGSYKLTVTVSAAGEAVHKAGKKNVSFTVKVTKAKNTLAVKSKPKTVKQGKVQKNRMVVAPITVKKKNGKLSFKVVDWTTPKAKKFIKLNSKNGKVIVKKGACKGTYKFKVKVIAAGTPNYKKGVKTVSVKVKVA